MPEPALATILSRIVEQRRTQLAVARSQERCPALRPEASLLDPESNTFLAALARRRGRAVIAEVKLGSPRLGSLAGRCDPLQLARTYSQAGAAALSVVVEPDFFFGSYELLSACQQASGLPAIAKDFVVDPWQLVWAQRAGASAVLLIAALYETAELEHWAQLARGLGLVPLIETDDPHAVAKLAGKNWELVGVNNRNLHTFAVAIETSLALLPDLPSQALKVSESGIHSASDRERLQRAGYDAYLIGEAFLTAADPAAKLKELIA